MTREYNGNVHDKGIVYVTGTGNDPRGAVEFKDTKSVYSSDDEDSWICYDFNDRCVIPTSYSVRSYGGLFVNGHNSPKSWVVEVSNDGELWMEIDRRENSDLANGGAPRHFKISSVPWQGFRFFRLRQTGKNHEGSYRLDIDALEIFGTLSVKKKVEQTRPPQQEFVYHEDREGQFPPPLFPPKLDGVIAYLTRECGGNVHDRGSVDVTANSAYENCRPNDVADLASCDWYVSNDRPNEWICYDFKDRRLIPKSYSVKSCDCSHLKSWVIEVSNDGKLWTEIDRRDNNNDLNNNMVTVNFKISRVPSERFRFFRLRQTGVSHGDDFYLVVTSLEVFGTLFEK